jgi:hypothetical protein
MRRVDHDTCRQRRPPLASTRGIDSDVDQGEFGILRRARRRRPVRSVNAETPFDDEYDAARRAAG